MNRSKKVVFVSHCLLNQNARAKKQGKAPGIVKDVMELFLESDVGVIQIPCPHVEHNGGVNRKITYNNGNGYEKACKKLSDSIIKQIEQYLREDYKVVGIVGVEFSQTCAVHRVNNGKKNSPGKGLLIEQIEGGMQKKNFQVPIMGVDLNNTYKSIQKIQSLLTFY